MRERDIVKLSEEEIKKIERVNESIERKEAAIAQKESHKKIRILFERAPRETLPFIVYVIYMGVTGLYVLSKILDYEGEKLYIGVLLLFILMVAPLFVLPTNTWKELFELFKRKVKRKTQ